MSTVKKKRKTSKTQKTKVSKKTSQVAPTKEVDSTEETTEQDVTQSIETELQPQQLTSMPLDSDVINVPFSKEELASMVNLIGISTKTFEALALAAADQGDNTKFLILSARYQMLATFGIKLQQVLQIGEPTSQSVH